LEPVISFIEHQYEKEETKNNRPKNIRDQESENVEAGAPSE